jgi:hypothetical protein
MGTEINIEINEKTLAISKEYDKLLIEIIAGPEDTTYIQIPLEKIKLLTTAIKEVEKELKQDKKDLYNNE